MAEIEITQTLDDAYIGSAYSPQVDITDTDEGHVVSITYMSPSGLATKSYTVPDWSEEEEARAEAEAQRLQAEADREIAEQARAAAEQTRAEAETAREQASAQAVDDAEAATAAANAAASTAATAATNADAKAQAAQTAAGNATTAAAAATSAAGDASTAATAANTAAGSATDAATAATTAAGAAGTAAASANDAASAANTAADAATAAAESIEDELASKADKRGAADQLLAATSRTVLGEASEGTFLSRVCPSKADGVAEISEVRGNTVVWNQLFRVRAASATINGVTFTNNGDGSITVDGTATGGDASFNFLNENNLNRIMTTYNHKYLMRGCPAGGSSTTYMLRENWWAWGAEYGNGIVIAITNAGRLQFQPQIKVIEGVTVNNLTFWPQFIDLTLMYGAGNEPSTVAEFEARWGSDYKPYSAPRLLDTHVLGMRTDTDELALPESTLRGIGTVQDVMTRDGIERHIGTVDMGTLYWDKYQNQFYANLVNAFQPYYSVIGNLRCTEYTPTSMSGFAADVDRVIALNNGQPRVNLVDSRYSTATELKSALQGVILEYELATPTTEQFEQPIDLTYTVQEGGTETWLVPEGDAPTSAPPTAVTAYPMDAADLRDLPLSAIAPVENGLASANYAVGDYLVRNGMLYKVTTAIAAGESIPASSISATTVAAMFKSLQ